MVFERNLVFYVIFDLCKIYYWRSEGGGAGIFTVPIAQGRTVPKPSGPQYLHPALHVGEETDRVDEAELTIEETKVSSVVL